MNDLAVSWIRSFEWFSFSFVHFAFYRFRASNSLTLWKFMLLKLVRDSMFEVEQIISRPRFQIIFHLIWVECLSHRRINWKPKSRRDKQIATTCMVEIAVEISDPKRIELILNMILLCNYSCYINDLKLVKKGEKFSLIFFTELEIINEA